MGIASATHEIPWSKDTFAVGEKIEYVDGVQIDGYLEETFIDVLNVDKIPKSIQAGTTNWVHFVTHMENLKPSPKNSLAFLNLTWLAVTDLGMQSALKNFVALDA